MQLRQAGVPTLVEEERVNAEREVNSDSWYYKINCELRDSRKQ